MFLLTIGTARNHSHVSFIPDLLDLFRICDGRFARVCGEQPLNGNDPRQRSLNLKFDPRNLQSTFLKGFAVKSTT